MAAGVAAAGTASGAQIEQSQTPQDFRIRNGRIRQSVMGWCFKPMPVPELIQHCAEIGLEAIEGIDPKFYPAAVKAGLGISLVSSHGFATGPANREHHAECVAKIRASIDTAVKFQAPSVITFTGMSVPGMAEATAEKNCLDCWKQVIDYAEEKEITLVLEHLNSRDDSHPMKGHPDTLAMMWSAVSTWCVGWTVRGSNCCLTFTMCRS